MNREGAVAGQRAGAARRVFLGIMEDLEHRRIVPGQRLIETELAERFSVGRNAVREAMQQLAGRGVVDLVRNRSSAIRKLDPEETQEVLDVAGVMTGLAARTAAQRIAGSPFAGDLAQAMDQLADPATALDPALFSRARRRFYRTLLAIGGNRELHRLFPAIGFHIIYSQYQSRELREIRLADYRAIFEAVRAGDPIAAERAGREHVDNVRAVIIALAAKEA